MKSTALGNLDGGSHDLTVQFKMKYNTDTQELNFTSRYIIMPLELAYKCITLFLEQQSLQLGLCGPTFTRYFRDLGIQQ